MADGRSSSPFPLPTQPNTSPQSNTDQTSQVNNIRAMRIQELLADFRTIHTWIASIRANPSPEDYHEPGFVVLRRCVAEAQALLAKPFYPINGNGNGGDEEGKKVHLQRIIVDAAARRFQAQKIYLRATAALRWVNARAAVLQGQRPHAGHAMALRQVRNNLDAELTSISDQRVEMTLRSADVQEGKWLVEDPGLRVLQEVIAEGLGR